MCVCVCVCVGVFSFDLKHVMLESLYVFKRK